MSMLSLMGALEIGLIFALVALGVWISFRVLDFPDLTADGSFPLGGAVAAVLIVGGWHPWLACGVAALTLRPGVEWGAPDAVPVDLVFMVTTPPDRDTLREGLRG